LALTIWDEGALPNKFQSLRADGRSQFLARSVSAGTHGYFRSWGRPAVPSACRPQPPLTPSRHGAAAAAAPDQGGEARLDLSEGSAVVMMLALRDSPWRQARNPARHISPKALVLRAECLLERRFFDHHHPDMKKKPE
jgi:hypothetical protein